MRLALVVLYVIGWIVHLTWMAWGNALIKAATPLSGARSMAATWACWLVIVVACKGCPFGYLHQYMELALGWRSRVTYSFSDTFIAAGLRAIGVLS